MRRTLKLLSALTLITALLTIPDAAQARWFAPDSIWNRPVPRGAKLDPRSPKLVGELVRQVRTYKRHIATGQTSVPIYTVGPDQPLAEVKLDAPDSPVLETALRSVPLPADAKPAPGPDGNLAVWQPATDTIWEFWRLRRGPDGWHTAWGGRHSRVSTSPGHYRRLRDGRGGILEQPWWGAPASKFPAVAGVMTIAELRAGRINHALSFALRRTRSDVFSLPAQATDGRFKGARYIPQGAHFRLDPNLHIGRLHLPRTTLIMARAAQQYGIVLENSSEGMVFRAEDPGPTGADPYYGPDHRPGGAGDLFSDWPTVLLKRFPWRHMQLLPVELRSLGDRSLAGT